MTSIYLSFLCTLGAIVFWAAIDPWFAQVAELMNGFFWLFIRSIPLRLRMEWDLFWMKRNMAKYMRMAEEIRKQIEDEQVRP